MRIRLRVPVEQGNAERVLRRMPDGWRGRPCGPAPPSPPPAGTGRRYADAIRAGRRGRRLHRPAGSASNGPDGGAPRAAPARPENTGSAPAAARSSRCTPTPGRLPFRPAAGRDAPCPSGRHGRRRWTRGVPGRPARGGGAWGRGCTRRRAGARGAPAPIPGRPPCGSCSAGRCPIRARPGRGRVRTVGWSRPRHRMNSSYPGLCVAGKKRRPPPAIRRRAPIRPFW